MSHPRRPRLFVVLVTGLALGLGAAVSGCSLDREPRLRSARDRAIAWFQREVTRIDGGWSVVFAYLHRRFGVTVTSAGGRTLHDATEGVEPEAIFAVFRRLVDPGAAVGVDRIAALASPIDRISASAIHCDRIPLPGDWLEVLARASRKGAYALTHAVAATEWSLENGCVSEMQVASLHVEQVYLLERLIEEREGLEDRHAAISDIWIEAVAMLFYSGAGERVRPEWIDAVLDLQRPDGSWPVHPRAPAGDAHATALGLWVTLEALDPQAPRVRWIP